tara:strand:+ start:80 stop:478 length:399 start_codon:yes stop_codon:yes gene_type:complete
MAGPHIWAAKKWSQYRQDVEKAKSKKRKEENDASQSDAEKKIRQWRKDRDKEERRKYVSDFDPFDETVDLKRYVQRPGKYSDIVIKTDLSRNPKELKKSAKSAEFIGTQLHKGRLYNASGKVMKRITDDPKD